jgi:hypothetical protein
MSPLGPFPIAVRKPLRGEICTFRASHFKNRHGGEARAFEPKFPASIRPWFFVSDKMMNAIKTIDAL